MQKVTYLLCTYACILNIVLMVFFLLVGTLQMAGLMGAAALSLYGGRELMGRAMRVQEDSAISVDTDGTNDFGDWDENDKRT